MAKPLIVVTGAIGKQGGSVVDHLLNENKFHVRGVTRHPHSEKAYLLEERGVEVVEADLKNKEDLIRCFQGAYGVFAVTNFWDPETQKNKNLEIEQGKNLVDAAVEANVHHFIWSSLPNTKTISEGKIDVPHFTGKAFVEEYARSKQNLNCTFVYPGFYASNFGTYIPFSIASDFIIEISLPLKPSQKLPIVDPSDIGKWVVTAFNHPEKFFGEKILMSSEYISLDDIAKAFTKVTCQPCRYVQSSWEEARKQYVHDLWLMFKYIEEYGYFNGEDIEPYKKLIEEPSSFEHYLWKTGYKIAI